MKKLSLLAAIFIVNIALGQSTTPTTTPSTSTPSKFWEKVSYGGGFGLNFGNAATDISLAPAMYYNFNEKVSLGASIQGSYTDVKDSFTSLTYGGSVIGIANVIPSIQLSGELEQLRYNTTTKNDLKVNGWNTALFLGAGYRTGKVAFGIRYNVLHQDANQIYSQAWMPFFRVMF